MCGGRGGWLIQQGHISYGTIMLYRATIFCKQNRILHPVMDHQLALLVWKEKNPIHSQKLAPCFGFIRPHGSFFLGQVSSWKRSGVGDGGRGVGWVTGEEPHEHGPDTALCGVSLLPPIRALEGRVSTFTLGHSSPFPESTPTITGRFWIFPASTHAALIFFIRCSFLQSQTGFVLQLIMSFLFDPWAGYVRILSYCSLIYEMEIIRSISSSYCIIKIWHVEYVI